MDVSSQILLCVNKTTQIGDGGEHSLTFPKQWDVVVVGGVSLLIPIQTHTMERGPALPAVQFLADF